MEQHGPAFEANRHAWNGRTQLHVASAFYDVEGFVSGRGSLAPPELELLGDVRGRDILHLQCHFGQDTLSLARMGARTTGMDLSDAAIDQARKLAERCGLHGEWMVGNVVDHHPALDGRFDLVFASYGAICWLPELRAWATNIACYLRPGGRFVFVEFHPVLWMFDNAFTGIAHSYFNRAEIIELETGTYADRRSTDVFQSHTWNHGIAEVVEALLGAGLRLEHFREIDGSPHDCFIGTVKGADGLFRIEGLEGKIPMVYGLTAVKGG